MFSFTFLPHAVILLPTPTRMVTFRLPHLFRLQSLLLLSAIYYLTAKGGLLLATAHPVASPIWPASGVAVFALVYFGSHLWPAIFVGAFVANVTSGISPVPALGIACGNTLEALVASWCIGRLALSPQRLFSSPESVFKYVVLVGIVSTSISATFGTSSLTVFTETGLEHYGSIWLTWWLGDMGGTLIVTPLLILWYHHRTIEWTPRELLERLAALCALIIASVAIYGGGLPISSGNYPLQIVVVPPLMWVAVRFGQRETATAILLLTVIATYGTTSGYGPFAAMTSVESMLLLQSFVIVLTITSLSLAAAFSQQREARVAIAESQQHIRGLLQEAERREQELREKQQQLVQVAKLASIGELTTGIAHELNNPLNNIGLCIGNALDQLEAGHPNDLIARHLRTGMQQVHRGAAIINNLRTFGRAASAENEPLPINTVVASALQLIEAPLRLSNIEVSLDLSPSNPVIVGNRIQLEQVFLNLLSNARDAVSEVPKGKIRVATWAEGDSTNVVFEDNGMGIPAEALPRIFDPFFTTKAVGQGTGLGLSIVYSIIREHRGKILAENRQEGGVRFLVQFAGS